MPKLGPAGQSWPIITFHLAHQEERKNDGDGLEIVILNQM